MNQLLPPLVMSRRILLATATVLAGTIVSACGGGGGGTTPAATAVNTSPLTSPTTTPTQAPSATPQVITMALPGGSAIGTETDPTFGAVAGYTEQTYSQVLAFPPGMQVMISNGQPASSATPHTLNVLSQSSFPASPALATTAAGGTTLAAGFASGSINAGSQIGPITLTAGTYYIGCGFHYLSNAMRTVLVVAANTNPGPQATPVPADTPMPNNQYGY
jgi:hypothetical protein